MDRYKTFLCSTGLASSTVCKYIHTVQRLFIAAGTQDIYCLTRETLEKYKKNLQKNCSAASLNTCIIACNRFFAWSGIPDMHLKTCRIQRPNVLENVISCDEYRRLLDAARKMGDMRMYYIMRLLASSGIRISELQFVTVEMLDAQYARIQNKGKSRIVFFPSELCRELSGYCAACRISEGIIFCGRDPEKMSDPSAVWRSLKKLAAVAGVPPEKVHAHNFRHLFAKQFMAKYKDLPELADILGHSSLETTRIYVRAGYEEKQRMADGLNL